jgi:hypothetical protein
MFLHVQSAQTSRVDNHCFFSNVLFSTICALFLLKIGKDFNIDYQKGEWNWIDENYCFITNLNIFGSKVLLTLKIMDFENVFLTKIIHVHVIKGMNDMNDIK